MKKIITFLLFLLTFFPVFSFDCTYKSTVSSNSLFKESPFNPYGYNSEIGVLYLPVKEERKIDFLTYYESTNDSKTATMISENLPIYSDDEDFMTFYIKGKLALQESFFLTTFDFGEKFPEITVDLSLKGYFSSVFETKNGYDLLAFDGSYFVGPEVEIKDLFVLRAGIHHLSGHYGDEMIEEFEKTYTVDHYYHTGAKTITLSGIDYEFFGLAQYVRDNEFMLSLQKSFDNGFTVYAEYNQPLYHSYVRPFFECPSGHGIPFKNLEGLEAWRKLAYGEGFWYVDYDFPAAKEQLETEWAKLSKYYKAIRINWGFTWEKMLFDKYQLILGLDVQAHQDGQTKHIFGGYSSSNPWEFEVTLGGEFNFSEPVTNHQLGLQLIYHWGRFQALNLFNNRVNTLYLGVRIH